MTLALVLTTAWGWGQTNLSGKVTDADLQEELIGANVYVTYINGAFVAGTSTDFDGNYSMNIDPGVYDVEVRYIGYPDQKIKGVVVKPNTNNRLDFQLRYGAPIIGCPIITCFDPPIIELDVPGIKPTLKGMEIRRQSGKEVRDLVSGMGFSVE